MWGCYKSFHVFLFLFKLRCSRWRSSKCGRQVEGLLKHRLWLSPMGVCNNKRVYNVLPYCRRNIDRKRVQMEGRIETGRMKGESGPPELSFTIQNAINLRLTMSGYSEIAWMYYIKKATNCFSLSHLILIFTYPIHSLRAIF